MGLLFDHAEVREESFVLSGSSGSRGAADILMVIDTSGSMAEEIENVKAFLRDNLLAPLEEIDYHFIIMAADPTIVSEVIGGVTYNNPNPIPLDLLSDIESDILRNTHVNKLVHSNNSYNKIVDNWDSAIKAKIRSNSILNIIIITDDNATMTYQNFEDQMSAKGRGDFIMHGIIGLTPGPGIDGVGQEYIDAIDATLGIKCDLTTPGAAWGSLFDQIAQNIIQNVNSTFYLKEDALSYGFHIYINNVEQIGNFSFNARNNSVTLIGVTFTAGDVLKIVYNTPVSGN
jgi:hypothetical protein